jgi:GDPmannose 4,6-dehydratase
MKIKNIQDIVRPEGTVVFVTGVTGQDGSHMVDYLLRETNAHIIGGARRLSVENHDNIRHLKTESRFQLVNFDLTDSHSIYKIMEYAKPDYFINFAAQSFVASSWDFARQTWEANSTSVLDCLEAIKRLAPNCRFYNAGSSEEFGNVSYSPQDEKHPANPRSPYGASKCAARTLIKVYRESYGIYAVQGWLFNHEGPRRGKEFVTRKITRSVAKIFDSIVNDTKIYPLELGNVDAQRDWSDAEDMMDGVWKMLNQDKFNEKLNQEQFNEFPELYNESKNKDQMTKWTTARIKDYVIGSGENHTIKEFVEKAFALVGIKGTWHGTGIETYFYYESGPKQLSEEFRKLVIINPKFYRPAEVDVLLSNSSKIREELGWKPKTTFEGLIDKMISNDLTLIKEMV